MHMPAPIGSVLDTSSLVSLIVVGSPTLEGCEDALLGAVGYIERRHAFFEILVIARESDASAIPLVRTIAGIAPQTRLIQIEGLVDFDQMSIHGYQEAIGDYVLVVSSDELPFVDLPSLLSPLLSGERLVRLRRRTGSMGERMASAILQSVTGLEIDTRFYRTLGLNRQLLSDLLARPEDIHLFRFTAHRIFGRQTVVETDRARVRKGTARLLSRMDLAARLVGTSAPRLLRFAGTGCVALAGFALLSLVYALTVRLWNNHVVEGWTTLTSMVAVWMFVQMTATAVICVGLSRLIERQDRKRPPRVSGEQSASALFAGSHFLNVEGQEPPAAIIDPMASLRTA